MSCLYMLDSYTCLYKSGGGSGSLVECHGNDFKVAVAFCIDKEMKKKFKTIVLKGSFGIFKPGPYIYIQYFCV